MKACLQIEAFQAELYEISAGQRGFFRPELDFNVPQTSLQADLALGRWFESVDVRHLRCKRQYSPNLSRAVQ